jgi:hypothetical protein
MELSGRALVYHVQGLYKKSHENDTIPTNNSPVRLIVGCQARLVI